MARRAFLVAQVRGGRGPLDLRLGRALTAHIVAAKVVEVSIYARIIELESTAECFRKLSKLGSERAARSLTSFGGAADEKSN